MSPVYMIVFTVGLAVQILAAAKACENGTARFDPEMNTLTDTLMGPHSGFVELCFDNQWHKFCGDTFNRLEATIICKQLGYIGSTDRGNNATSDSGPFVILGTQTCYGYENAVSECQNLKKTVQNFCSFYRWVKCLPADCTNDTLRLVGEASYREGRVEVCVDGRWGTVCYNEELAGTVCQQLGFGSQVPGDITHAVSTNTVNDNIGSTCQPASGGGTVSAALGAVIGLLIVTQALTIITLVVCVLRAKQQTDKSQQRVLTHPNKSYEDNPPVESAYSVLGPNYETTHTSGGPIPDYDVLDHNRPATVAPAHPPPVGGVSNDEFYNADDHTYAAVNKNAIKKKKQSREDTEEGENDDSM